MKLTGQNHSSSIRSFAFRLTPGQDLKWEILRFAKRNKIGAGCVLTCVGSLNQINLRFANQDQETLKRGFFEITSLVGTFSHLSSHLHVTIAGPDGKTIGGHLLEGTIIYTTAEIVIAELPDLQFSREKDSDSGYLELVILPKKARSKKK